MTHGMTHGMAQGTTTGMAAGGMMQDREWQETPSGGAAREGGRLPQGAVLVDVHASGGVDLDRLERAVALQAGRVGPGRYRVSGGSQHHWVDLASLGHPRCDCGDHLWRDQVCKHILAALLREGDPAVVAALAQVTRRLQERLRAAQLAAHAATQAVAQAAGARRSAPLADGDGANTGRERRAA